MRLSILLLAAALILPLGARAERARDMPPAVPDGATVAEADLVSTQQAIKAYVASNDAYLACLDQEGAAAGVEEAAELKAARVAAYNDSVDEMTASAAAFNTAVKAYKATHPK